MAQNHPTYTPDEYKELYGKVFHALHILNPELSKGELVEAAIKTMKEGRKAVHNVIESAEGGETLTGDLLAEALLKQNEKNQLKELKSVNPSTYIPPKSKEDLNQEEAREIQRIIKHQLTDGGKGNIIKDAIEAIIGQTPDPKTEEAIKQELINDPTILYTGQCRALMRYLSPLGRIREKNTILRIIYNVIFPNSDFTPPL